MDTVDCRDYVDYGYSGLYIQWITGYNSVAPQNALAFVPCYFLCVLLCIALESSNVMFKE